MSKRRKKPAAPKPQEPPQMYGQTAGKTPSLHVLMPISKAHSLSQVARERMLIGGGIRSELGDRYSNACDRPVHDARNELARQFVAGGCDIALWIDDDMVYEPAHVHAMRKLMAELPEDVGIASAICVDRKGNNLICAYQMNDTSKHYDRIHYGEFPDDEPFPVAGVGMAFTAVRRWVYEALPQIKEGWYWFFPALSEDLHFCTRAREEAGAKIVVDPRIRVGHMGEVVSVYEPGEQATVRMATRHLIDRINESIDDGKAERNAAKIAALQEIKAALEPATIPTAVPAHMGAI